MNVEWDGRRGIGKVKGEESDISVGINGALRPVIPWVI